MVQPIGPHRHQGPGFDAVAVDHDVAGRQSGYTRGGRTQPQRLVQHLHGVTEASHILGSQLPIADGGDFRGNASLDVGMVSEHPQRVRQRGRGGVMSGEHEDQQVVRDVVIGDRQPGLRVPRRHQRPHERGVARRVGVTRAHLSSVISFISATALRVRRRAGVGSQPGARTGRSARSAV